jgi:pantetheine-phosphate adenylyltransferase
MCAGLEFAVNSKPTVCVPIRGPTNLRRGQLKRVIAIYPGTFDPPTNGHLDLIQRGSKIFDELVVAILRNPEKEPALFSLAERRAMLESLTKPFANVRVDIFGGLLVDYAMRTGARALLRGIRAISDYEYELQMALMNRKLDPQLETVFMMPAETYSYVSSRLVKEIVQLGGSVHGLIPDLVEKKLTEKVNGRKHSLQSSAAGLQETPTRGRQHQPRGRRK